MAAPFAAVGIGCALWALASHVNPTFLGASFHVSPRSHRFSDISVSWSAGGHPLLAAILHDAAVVCGLGGWIIAAVVVGRAATHRAPTTGNRVRTGVWLARAGTCCTALLTAVISVYVAAIALQPWHVVASHACSQIPRWLWVASSCSPGAAPANHVVLTSPLAGAAPLWIALAVACAAMAILAARIAGRSMKSAEALEAA